MMKEALRQGDITCDMVIQCMYDLSDLDKNILEILRDGEEFRTNDVAELIERDQSTAYRSLERLVKCGLIYKEKQNIRNGGYYFLYSAKPLDNIKKEAFECLEEWYERMKKAIEEL